MRLVYMRSNPLGFPYGWKCYHVRWMMEVPEVILADTETKEWAHISHRGFPCFHIAERIKVNFSAKLVLIDPIDDDEVDANDVKIARPIPTPTS